MLCREFMFLQLLWPKNFEYSVPKSSAHCKLVSAFASIVCVSSTQRYFPILPVVCLFACVFIGCSMLDLYLGLEMELCFVSSVHILLGKQITLL